MRAMAVADADDDAALVLLSLVVDLVAVLHACAIRLLQAARRTHDVSVPLGPPARNIGALLRRPFVVRQAARAGVDDLLEAEEAILKAVHVFAAERARARAARPRKLRRGVEVDSHAPAHLERHRICTEVAQLWDGAHLTDPRAPRRLAPAGYRLRPGIALSLRHDRRCRWHGERGKALHGGQQGEVKVMRQERMADEVPCRPMPLCAAL